MRLTQHNKTKTKTYFEIKDFRGATNLLLDEARVAPNEAVVSKNLIQIQDGLWAPRWGTDYYGVDVGADMDGAIEFVRSDATTEVVAIAGGTAYKSQNGGSWSAISGGAIFTAGLQCYFKQLGGYLYIVNGTDKLARYDGSVITTYSQLSAPSGLGGVATSTIAGGSYYQWAVVTALNEVGETIGSAEASVAISKTRDTWNADKTNIKDKIAWTWSTVSGATRYQIYISDEPGHELYVGSVASPALTFTDDGTTAVNDYIEVPLDNTTEAPYFKSMCISGNRIWATNDTKDTDSLYKVYFSGTGTNMGAFSAFYGGGWINLERGGRELPQAVVHYQSGTGTGMATVLCKTPEGRGAVWQISLEALSVGDTTFTVPSAIKVIGSFGTESLLGVVQTTNDIMFPNRRGWFSLGPKQNYYGILRTEEISAKIRPYWTSLKGSAIPGICSYFYDAKVFISVPTTSEGNDRIIIMDTERNNWNVEWTIGAKQFFEYTTTTGVTKLLYLPMAGHRLIELSENIQGDLGVAFSTDYTSGRYPLDKLWKDFVKLTKVYLKLGSARGTINFSVTGSQKVKGFTEIVAKTITPQYSDTGMGYDEMGAVLMGDTLGTPNLFADRSDPRYVKIRKKLRDVQLRVTTTTIDSYYILQGFILESNKLVTQSPRAWKL